MNDDGITVFRKTLKLAGNENSILGHLLWCAVPQHTHTHRTSEKTGILILVTNIKNSL